MTSEESREVKKKDEGRKADEWQLVEEESVLIRIHRKPRRGLYAQS